MIKFCFYKRKIQKNKNNKTILLNRIQIFLTFPQSIITFIMNLTAIKKLLLKMIILKWPYQNIINIFCTRLIVAMNVYTHEYLS
jgi:hypothetical protein